LLCNNSTSSLFSSLALHFESVAGGLWGFFEPGSLRFSSLFPLFALEDVFFLPTGSMSGGNRTSLVISFLVLLSALEDVFFLPA
jgi:hypothetical protein